MDENLRKVTGSVRRRTMGGYVATEIEYSRDRVSSRGRDETETDRYRLSEAAPVGELAAGTRIGRYVVEHRLGAGGMGVVYSARDSVLGRSIALKIVRSRTDDAAMQARLLREARAMARLKHANVVSVYDSDRHDGQVYLAMELVEGETLRTWVVEPRPWRDVVRVFVKAGRGLAAAHAAGLLHRDFKPDNVMIDSSDEPRITDFGLARELAVDDTAADMRAAASNRELPRVTRTGALAGTLMYTAPEHVLGDRPGTASDQFGYCASLFEVLHGTHPFQPASHTPEDWVAEIRAGRIAKPTEHRGVPGWLRAAVVRGLAFDPAQRWSSMSVLIDALERGLARRRRHVAAAVATIAIAAIASVLAIRSALGPHPADGAFVDESGSTKPPTCVAVARRADDAATIAVCRDEYVRTGDAFVGAELADALRRTRHPDAAVIAKELLATSAEPDARYTLGKIAEDEGRTDHAVALFRRAAELHREQQKPGKAATDLLAAARHASDFVEQLVDLDQAASDARRAARGASDAQRPRDQRVEAYSHLGAALALSTIGARSSAMDELARAVPLLNTPRDWIELERTRGDVYQNLGENALAIGAFETLHALATLQALAAGAVRPTARATLSIRLNVAYSLAESGRLADAVAELKAANALDVDDHQLVDRLTIEARIAARGGDLTRAAALVERALASADRSAPEDLLEIEVQRAEIALQQEQLATAESWARRAIARIEQLRSPNPPVELRSWMITDRRIPYEILFASLAGRGHAEQALLVFDRYRGLDMLATLIREPAGVPIDLRTRFPISDVARLLPLLATSELATPATDPAIRDATRAGSMLALVVARGEVWRIVADRGRLEVARIAPLSTLRPLLDRFRSAPTDLATGAELGARLVPADLTRPSDRVLRVVLDEQLGWLPVAALRVGERRLISARPVVLAARPSIASCAPRRREPRRVVRLEASTATRASLFAMTPADRLHLAVPTETDVLGHAAVLRDRRIRALEIAGHAGAPGQVVLETPGGSAGTAALAIAFVAAGSDQVIATVRPVTPAAIARLAEQLDRVDPADLVSSLAHIQRASDDDELLGFVAVGRATCKNTER